MTNSKTKKKTCKTCKYYKQVIDIDYFKCSNPKSKHNECYMKDNDSCEDWEKKNNW